MARTTGRKVRGRKREPLRIAAAELAANLRPGRGEHDVTIEVIPGEGRKRGETVTITVPKGTVAVPVELTEGKTPENVRQQLRNGAADAGVEVSIMSEGWVSDDDTKQGTLYFVSLKA